MDETAPTPAATAPTSLEREKLYSVSEIAEELGITPRTLRLYEANGLIAPRRAGNARVYSQRERGRLILILRGKRLGFSLREISSWLDLYDTDTSQVAQMRWLLKATRERISSLEAQRLALDETLKELRDIEKAVLKHQKSQDPNRGNGQEPPPSGATPKR
jgi:DNA-binding transcriptional MerR regulator